MSGTPYVINTWLLLFSLVGPELKYSDRVPLLRTLGLIRSGEMRAVGPERPALDTDAW